MVYLYLYRKHNGNASYTVSIMAYIVLIYLFFGIFSPPILVENVFSLFAFGQPKIFIVITNFMNFSGAYQEFRLPKIFTSFCRSNFYISLGNAMVRTFEEKNTFFMRVGCLCVIISQSERCWMFNAYKIVQKRSSQNKCYFKANTQNYTIRCRRGFMHSRNIILRGNKIAHAFILQTKRVRNSFVRVLKMKTANPMDTPKGCYNCIKDSALCRFRWCFFFLLLFPFSKFHLHKARKIYLNLF